MARRLGATDVDLAAVAGGVYETFEPAWRAALGYADAVTPSQPDVSDEAYRALARWWDAGQIVEITAVIALFNYFNRVANALRIPPTR